MKPVEVKAYKCGHCKNIFTSKNKANDCCKYLNSQKVKPIFTSYKWEELICYSGGHQCAAFDVYGTTTLKISGKNYTFNILWNIGEEYVTFCDNALFNKNTKEIAKKLNMDEMDCGEDILTIFCSNFAHKITYPSYKEVANLIRRKKVKAQEKPKES